MRLILYYRGLEYFCALGIVAVLCGGCSPPAEPEPSAIQASPATHSTRPPPVSIPTQPSTATTVQLIAPQFANVAAALGINAPFYTDITPDRYFLPEIMGGGVTWIDFDVDGVLDIHFTNGTLLDPQSTRMRPRGDWLYRGRQGEMFQPVPAEWGASDPGYGQGSTAGDFNADGFPDLYVGNFGPNSLYTNEGDGTFSRDETSPDIADPAWTSSVVWVDVNRDGLLDLYVTNYLDMTLADRKICEYDGRPGYCGPGQYESAPDHVYLNQGDGQFIESAGALGLNDTFGKGLAVVVADLNQDLQPEIYVGNDMTPNFLFTPATDDASGELKYRDVANIGGAAQSGEGMNEASMGISCSDFDGDTLLDIFLTHYYNSQDTLYRNHGDLQFEDISKRMGTAQVGYAYLGFGTIPIDYDGDGLDDIFIANGHVLGPLVQPDRMPPQLLHNRNGKRFDDVSSDIPGYFKQNWLGRGAASADFDSDGDLDIAVTHLDDPAALLQNSTVTGKQFVGLKLSTAQRIQPIGTRVTVTTPHLTKTRSLTAGGSYLSSSDDRLLYHIEPGISTVDVKVEWSSGHIEEHRGLTVGRYWHLFEGRQPW